ncbi:5-carboxymethyl-2-hydroxymuconate Delta-isomerase [Colwellia hornerae]|uniref:5-carboxymethyl-2-hydroxymuconate Delta-isomerase n=1 Tax=Colwellia hornerae TaxID=89402 RepID=A0A5C6Q6L4_9GAMM|nr:5-carboxymethyl-2-hydroxymuconate Delta-isomerase [Colwellia hornerae]TWX49154.1 5-carboxymethyl-2-hydroxymuconate Delta-isomerase [Colwellia hornerae]TWX55581.1 5-carboxymethyl-2-hydroxymuconate Delta-isomerase [Colwellia hornerae]TWX64483.1 5-carboxymethyl-2-hydroxymuconate Delta-isomerase [Colwellia hornerae]
MPHCIIEYSQELNETLTVKALMSAVFLAATESTLFSPSDIKIRAMAFNDFYAQTPNGVHNNPQRFIHVCCKILSGRTGKQRQQLSQLVLEHLNRFAIQSVSISVEIVDIERDSYNKCVS